MIDNLTSGDEIPDMDSFREVPASSQEESAGDDQALYQDSSLSVSESSLLVMAFAVRHKLSGVALEDLLELIQLHCPKPNKCITEMKEFQLFFQALKHPILKHYYCPNIVCKVYTLVVQSLKVEPSVQSVQRLFAVQLISLKFLLWNN